MRSVSPRWVRHSARVPHPNPSTSNIASDQTTPDIILETLIALSSRIGKAKAITATARKIAVLFYNTLRVCRPRATYYEDRYRQLVLHNHDLKDIGDRIFLRRTGFVTLDRLLRRLHANKAELLMVLDRPQTPLHTQRVGE
jgi:hypothetical protein